MDFLRPESLQEALFLLAEHLSYTVLAGGTDVVVRRRAGKLTPGGYLDITRIPELREIRCGETVFVGAAAVCAELERSAVLQTYGPLLAAADLVPALTAAGAKAVIGRQGGRRRADIPDLVQGPGRCALEEGELIIGFEIPAFSPNTRWNFDKIGRRNALAISRMNGAVRWEEDGGRMKNVRLCIGAAARRPGRFSGAESLLEGQAPDKPLFLRAGQAVSEEILAQTGLRESSRYKLPVSAEFTARLLENAMGRIQV